MFAPMFSKQPATLGEDRPGRSAYRRSTSSGCGCDLNPASAVGPFRRAIGNQATLWRLGHAPMERKCAVCENEPAATLQSKATRPVSGAGDEVPDTVRNVLASTGRPLDAESRTFFQPRFGHDFSRVRIHVNDEAVASANAVGARAYTVGSHVVFARNAYAVKRNLKLIQLRTQTQFEFDTPADTVIS